jgi:hypothetical protein
MDLNSVPEPIDWDHSITEICDVRREDPGLVMDCGDGVWTFVAAEEAKQYIEEHGHWRR